MIDKDNETIAFIANGRFEEGKLEKMFALKAFKSNPYILENAFIFEKFVYACNELKSSAESFEPASILQICKAIDIVKKERPHFLWNNEVIWYIAHIAHNEGWVAPLPDILSFVNSALKELERFQGELTPEQQKMQELKHLAVKMYLTDAETK